MKRIKASSPGACVIGGRLPNGGVYKVVFNKKGEARATDEVAAHLIAKTGCTYIEEPEKEQEIE
jgi:hypothetical protein